jgi:hypothetical protein
MLRATSKVGMAGLLLLQIGAKFKRRLPHGEPVGTIISKI